jgi:hypothetical protein
MLDGRLRSAGMGSWAQNCGLLLVGSDVETKWAGARGGLFFQMDLMESWAADTGPNHVVFFLISYLAFVFYKTNYPKK